ncbi:TIGR00180 family glycosyltransferase [Chloroflexota bacterium]
MKCSIIIPTHNRPGYLERILNYYSQNSKDFDIIIADSSTDEIKKVNEETVSLFSILNIQHLNYYSTGVVPLCKIVDAINHINTKYSVFCADDDFITPNGINQSVDFLEENLDFSVAHGHYISFYLKDNREEDQQFYWRPTYSHESIIIPEPSARLNYHLSNYSQATFYAVHRTDFMRMIYGETLRFTDEFRFAELLLTMLTSIYGKIKCLDVLYTAREYSGSSLGQTINSIKDYMKDDTYSEKYALFRDCLSVHLSKQSQLNIGESKKVIDDAMSAYIKKYYRINPLVNKMVGILDYLRFPNWIDKNIRALYRTLFITKRARQKFYSSFSLEIPLTYEHYDGLNKIRLHVLSHAK